jgi:ubiquitin carboxyl-terminal hydrolase 9/24
MPTRLREEIREENLKFSRDRDIYNTDYFTFTDHLIGDVIDTSIDNQGSIMDAIRFAFPFTAHFAWHTKRSLRGDATIYADRIALLLKHSRQACTWMMEELTNELKVSYYSGIINYVIQTIEDLLINCDATDVRRAFTDLLKTLFEYSDEISSNSDKIIDYLISLAKKEAIDRWTISGSIFNVLNFYATRSRRTAQHLLERGAFRACLHFLFYLPSTTTTTNTVIKLSRRWSATQARDFTDIWCIIAELVQQCDLRPSSMVATSSMMVPSSLPMPDAMRDVLVGDQMSAFARELIWSLVYVNAVATRIVAMIGCVIGVNEAFARAIMIETLIGIGTCEFATAELKNLFLVVATLVDDSSPVMCQRVIMLLDGPDIDADETSTHSNVSVTFTYFHSVQ